MISWASDDERRRLLAAIKATPPPEPIRGKKKGDKQKVSEERKLALLKLRDIACSPLREALWEDTEVQDALLAGMEKTQPELARVLSLGVVVHLAVSAENCKLLLHNEKVRLSLAKLQSDEEQQQVVQEKGLLVLIALTGPAFGACHDVSEDLRDILGKVARDRSTAQRLLVFRALASAAVVSESPELYFGNDKIWEALLQNIQEEDDDLRESSLGFLSAIAGQQAVAHFLWQDDEPWPACEHIYLNTLPSQPPRVRGRALTVLAGVVKDPDKRASVWSYVSLASRSDDDPFPASYPGKPGPPADGNARRERSGRNLLQVSDRDRDRERKTSKSSDTSQRRSRQGSKQSTGEEETTLTMQESIMAATAAEELPAVRWPALKILLELSWDESLKMSLIESNIPELLLDAVPDERLGPKERKLCKHGAARLIDWNEARIAEELRIMRENEPRERQAMQAEEDFQVLVREYPDMCKADFESQEFEDWSKRQRETTDMKKEDVLSDKYRKYLLFLLAQDREFMELEDRRSHLVREEEEAQAFAEKIRAAREKASVAADEAAEAMRRIGGDAVLQARDAAAAAAAAAAKARMPPRLQAEFAAEAAVARAKKLSQKEQLDEACRAALQVADRCGMTQEEKIAVVAAAAEATAEVNGATQEQRETACSLALSGNA